MQTGGPFNLLEAAVKGTAHPEGFAQDTMVRKWYTYLTGIAEEIKLTRGHTIALQQPFKPSPILNAPPSPSKHQWKAFGSLMPQQKG